MDEKVTLKSLKTELAALDAFVRSLYETVDVMNQHLHGLVHKLKDLEGKVNASNNRNWL